MSKKRPVNFRDISNKDRIQEDGSQAKETGMDGLTQTEINKKWLAWTGVKPKVDWTGFEVTTLMDYEIPNQMRPVYNIKG